MATRLDHRIRRLRLRKTDANANIRILNENLRKSGGNFDTAKDALEYISESMVAVDNDYTRMTFEECDRVQKHIAEACQTRNVPVSFEHQGSVTTDTHIRYYSDIDLLVLSEKFFSLQSPLKATYPYQGNPVEDLQEIRSIVVDRLTTSFPKATVDNTGSKAVALSGGSLRRKIDIIAANWLDTSKYQQTQDTMERGIQILDMKSSIRISNFPFIHNRELEQKNTQTGGQLKRLIRFVKSSRYDADSPIKVSSYDIASLCFHLPIESFRQTSGNDYALAHAFLNFSDKVRLDENLQNTLYVPNNTRKIFGNGGIKAVDLKELNEEIYSILNQAQTSRNFK